VYFSPSMKAVHKRSDKTACEKEYASRVPLSSSSE